MSKSPTIFISYNPMVSQEETLAVRLQTIGAVNGFTTLLPDRFNNKNFVDNETIRRISSSDYFVIFVLDLISKTVQDEIEVAFKHFHDASKIVIIHSKHSVQQLHLKHPSSVTAIPFDPTVETVDVVIKKVIRKISQKEKSKERNEMQNGLLALLGIGLGLWALAAMFNDNK